ncbi:intradiol ring-cleavage dioxygenase [Rathayibacter sp. VKM Ac-2760]|uniref:intradiol ring-cleavage dioxygenase n=1 Tax=Rathayibacter sp. VKM Ac-2760 TaxID=2609253 RepID=UPI00131988EA|nr:intradiol ring-cleavage dioxygenase [Rathayibacter sp. VKM Ac-2760]QHC60296.1 3,4-dioxygenase subunit beta [Rathayibacter sp. VKM Ac-2760]
MARIPEPDRTPDGPRYEGRALDRPDEEVVDQGLAFDVRTLLERRVLGRTVLGRTVLGRRRVLGLIGVGAATTVLAACSAAAGSTGASTSTAAAAAAAAAATATATAATGEIPDETAGPYPGDGSNGPDVLSNSGIVRSDIRSSIDGGGTATGVPLTFTLTILDLANGGVPFENAAVYVWHCDAAGGYSMYSDGITEETYLRGVQVADAKGEVSYTSVFPACYSGRWPHIHFEVYPDVDSISDSGNAIATSQLAVPEDACTAVYALSGYEGSSENLAQVSLANDNVFSDDGGELQLATATGDATAGYHFALSVGVDTTTEPTGGSVPSGGGGGGAGGGRPPSA